VRLRADVLNLRLRPDVLVLWMRVWRLLILWLLNRHLLKLFDMRWI
jgi:hypothetical protein